MRSVLKRMNSEDSFRSNFEVNGYLLDSNDSYMWHFVMVEEYPRSLLELEEMFSTEEACRKYLFCLRWPDGFRCSRCREASKPKMYREILFRVDTRSTLCEYRQFISRETCP